MSKMAAKKEALDKLEEQITCSVCLDTFTDPKQLQCHHVYCRGCLVKLVERDEQGQLVLSCPNCRKITPVPANGVRGLQPAFQTNNLLEIQDSLKKALIQEETDGASGETPPGPDKVISYCAEHNDELIKLYCKDCNVFTCYQCCIDGGKHQHHNYKTLDSYRNDILSSLQPVNEQLTTTSDASKEIDTQHSEISDQSKDIDAHIDRIIGELHEILDTRKTELKAQLCHLTEYKLDSLKSQKEQIMKTHAQLEQCKSDIHEKLQQLKDDREVVAMKQSVTTQISDLTSTFQPEAMKPVTSADMELNMSDTLATLCQRYGTLTAHELQPDPSKCFITNPFCLEVAEVNFPVEVNIQAINYIGNPCQVLPSQFYKLVSEVKGLQDCAPCEESESQYLVNFTPRVKGRYRLDVTMNGHSIQGGPFTVHVKSPFRKIQDQIKSIDDIVEPWGIAISKKREIFVSENNKHCIAVYSTNGTKLRSFGTWGSKNGKLKDPRGIALDDSDNIVVADHGNNRIQMFAEDGWFIKAVYTKGSKYSPSNFNGPSAVSFNTYNQRFYIIDEDGDIQILDSELNFFGQFGGGASILRYEDGKFSPESWIGCDQTGQVYVADSIRNHIQVFTAEGRFLRVIGKFINGIFKTPTGIAFNASNMYVVNHSSHCLSVIDHTIINL